MNVCLKRTPRDIGSCTALNGSKSDLKMVLLKIPGNGVLLFTKKCTRSPAKTHSRTPEARFVNPKPRFLSIKGQRSPVELHTGKNPSGSSSIRDVSISPAGNNRVTRCHRVIWNPAKFKGLNGACLLWSMDEGERHRLLPLLVDELLLLVRWLRHLATNCFLLTVSPATRKTNQNWVRS